MCHAGGEVPPRLLGERYLGAGLGSLEFREAAVRTRVEGWRRDVMRLAAFGRVHPHAAYSLFVRTLLPRWRYTMRNFRVPSQLFQPLEDVVLDSLFPSVFGWSPRTLSDFALRRRCALPTRHGGLGIPVITALAEEEASASQTLTETLSQAILEQDGSFVEDLRAVRTRRDARLVARNKGFEELANQLKEGLEGRAARGFEEARLRGGSAWMSVIPLGCLGLMLDAQSFRDAIALRMGLPLAEALPPRCASCGELGTVDHLLQCKRGGWVSKRHREILKAWVEYFRRGGATAVHDEPLLPPVPHGVFMRPSTTTATEARADIVVRGLFRHGENHYTDIACIDTGAARYRNMTSAEALKQYEERKNDKYADRIAPHGTFVPLVCSIYGSFAPSARRFARQVAANIDADRDERDQVMDLHSTMVQVAVLRAVSLCLRARSWGAVPLGPRVDVVEDASGWLGAADARADL